jgi:cytochrome P450
MIRGIFYANHRLFTIDPRTIHHIMSQPNLYGKPALLRRVMSRYMKEGLLVAEGQRHRVQRKVTQKVFSSKAMRDMVDVVEVKANQAGRPSKFSPRDADTD